MSYRQYVKWRLDEEVPFPVYESAVEAMMADISAKAASLAYFRVCDEEGRSDGTYALIARCKDLVDCRALTESILGRLSAYIKRDSLTADYLQAEHEDMWFDYTDEKVASERLAGITNTRYLEYEHWLLAEGADKAAYGNIIDVWFRYVTEHKERLFDEWVSARYYRNVDGRGKPTGKYAMIFEYVSHPEFQAYKRRRRHSYDTDTGDYLVYRDNDPYQFFNKDTVGTDGLWPEKMGHWFGK